MATCQDQSAFPDAVETDEKKSMKKLFLLSALLVISLLQAVADENVPVQVSTAEEFDAAVKASKDIVLTDNINMTGYPTINATFKGTIDGRGFVEGKDTIYTIYKTDRDKKSTTHTPLVNDMKGATVQNVIFSGFRVESDSESNQGVLGSCIEGCVIKNVTLYGVSVFSDEDNAGALAGKSLGSTITNVKALNCNVTVDGVGAGAIVGSSLNSTFTQCLTNVYTWVFADGRTFFENSAYAGGICGLSSGDTFTECVNLALIGANDDAVGGIVGHSKLSRFYNCTNMGYIYQTDEETFHGDISSIQADIESKIRNCRVEAIGGFFIALPGTMTALAIPFWITLTFPPAAIITAVCIAITGTVLCIVGLAQGYDEVGGIVGSAFGGEISCCSNYGYCGCRDSSAGGIVGLADRPDSNSAGVDINNCLNAGTVQSSYHIGGIVGDLYHSSLRNCLNVGEVKSDYEDKSGSLFGYQEGGSWNNNYFKWGIYDPTAGGRVKVTEEQLSSGQVAWWLNQGQTDGPWRQNLTGDDTDPYPVLELDHNKVTPDDLANRFAISNADELMAFAAAVNTREVEAQTFTAYLTDDIDLSGKTWIPIGTESKPFYGLFFGCGHIIRNLQCNVTHRDAGLFGTIGMRTEIHDVTIDHNSRITSAQNAVGGIVGCVRVPAGNIGQVKITGCGNRATVQGSYNVGGILGAVYFDSDLKLEIRDCYNAGTIYATSKGEGNTGTGESGVICGAVKASSIITDCWNIGVVKVATATGVSSQPSTAYYNGRYFAYYGGGKPQISHCYSLLTDMGNAQDGVEKITLEDISDGTLCFLLNNETNDTQTSTGLRWEMELGDASTLCYTGFDSHGRGIYHSRTISNPIGTIVLPYDVESNDDVTFYELLGTVTPGVLSFQSVDVLGAGVPGLFRIHTDEEGPVTYDFLSTGDVFKPSEDYLTDYCNGDWKMYGTYSGVTITDDATLGKTYYVSGGEVRQATKSLTIAPYRAYIQSETGISANGLRVSLDGKTTDIVFIPADKPSLEDDAPIYDLFGRCAVNPQQGIYIQNGKEFLVK